jgi:signal transduction histidine kinase
MGGDVREESLKQDDLVAQQTQQVIAVGLARAEVWVRSARVNLAVTCLAMGLAAVAFALDSSLLPLGQLTAARIAVLLLTAWVPYELATLAHHRFGPDDRLSRLARDLDAMTRAAALLLALVFSGPAVVVFMLLAISRSFAWQARPPKQLHRSVVLEAVSHGAVAAFSVATGRPAMATLVVLNFFALVIGLSMTGRALARAAAARVERDLLESQLAAGELSRVRSRIAREIHDGAGANLMALVLQLRRGAQAEPALALLHAEAQMLLEDLRSVVWSIRGGQGTLGELVKLLDARCARLCEGLSYERSKPPLGTEHTPIGAVAALTALRVGPQLVRFAAKAPSTRRLRFEFQVDPSLQLSLEADSAADVSGPELDEARLWLAEVGGALTFVATAGSSGGRLQALIPLEAQA